MRPSLFPAWAVGVGLTLVGLVSSSGCISARRISRATSQVDLGTAYYREGNVEGAVEALRAAVELDPRNWHAWDTLAVAYIAKGENDLAADAFKRSLRIAPGEGEVLLNYGAWLLNQGRGAEAIEAFIGATKDLDYRNQSMVLSNLSLAYLGADRPAEALASAREAVRRTPDLCEAWFHVGLAEEARGGVPAAIEAYDTLIQRCPQESVGARLRVGCLLVQGSDPAGGMEALERVMHEAPGTTLADEARVCMNEGAH